MRSSSSSGSAGGAASSASSNASANASSGTLGSTTSSSSGGGPPGGGPLLGVCEQGNVAATDSVQAWLGKTIMVASVTANNGAWSGIDNPAWLKTQGWPAWKSAVPGRRLLVQVDFPAADSSGSPTLAACANHDYDTHWTSLGQNLVAWGLGDAELRFLHEFNGGWYPSWSPFATPTGPAEFVACFQSFVTAARKVAGQHFTFNWNPALGGNNDVSQTYPGDTYVDSIGVDFYDTWYTDNTQQSSATQQEATWQILLDPSSTLNPVSTHHGLTYYVKFATAHQKPLTFPEWGTQDYPHHGGGDDPIFIQHVHDFFFVHANGVAWHVYFNVLSSDGKDHKLYPMNEFPLSTAKYLEAFGSPGGG